ncbi:MAG TPA: SPOR domain-containing protein [Pseudolabrys sp.]
MADDHSQRSYRSNDALARREQPKAHGTGAGNDPLAELARLIGQSDPFGEYGRANAAQTQHPAAEWPQEGHGDAHNDWAPQIPRQAPPQAPVRAPAPMTPAQSQAYAAPVPDFIRRAPAAAPAAPAPMLAQYDVRQDQYQDQYDEHADAGYEPEHAQYAEEQDFYDDVPPPRRRIGIMAVAGIFALAVIGTAGAFGYRAVFGSSGSSAPPPVIKADTAPSKIVPVASNDGSNKLITDRVNASGQGEKMVSREEQPVDVKDKPPGAMLPQAQQADQANAAPPMPTSNGIIATDPKKVRTIAIRPDQTVIADASPNGVFPDASPPQAAPPMPQPPREAAPAARPTPQRPQPQAAAPASENGPLSLNPDAPTRRAATRTANAAPTQLSPQTTTGSTGGYAVQVTSQRTEAEAQAAYRALQGKYADALSGKPMFVHKVDLGSKGVYYRAMVGPYANQAEAGQVCSSLKSAGGQCFVQRN